MLSIFDINTLGSGNSAISFNNVSNFTTILFNEFTCPVSYITKCLNCECFTFNTKSTSCWFLNKWFKIQALSNWVINTKTSWFSSSGNTSLPDMFTCAATFRVDIVLTSNTLISIFDPCHNLFVSTHIWT